jgi:hypothetical protein
MYLVLNGLVTYLAFIIKFVAQITSSLAQTFTS